MDGRISENILCQKRDEWFSRLQDFFDRKTVYPEGFRMMGSTAFSPINICEEPEAARKDPETINRYGSAVGQPPGKIAQYVWTKTESCAIMKPHGICFSDTEEPLCILGMPQG